jgi:hypothetical protein
MRQRTLHVHLFFAGPLAVDSWEKEIIDSVACEILVLLQVYSFCNDISGLVLSFIAGT